MSDETLADTPRETNGSTRGRPRGSTNRKPEPKRSYVTELAELQARVKMAVWILDMPAPANSDVLAERMNTVRAVLNGER